MAVRAEEIAFCRFRDEFFPRPVEIGERELLGAWVPVVKLERRDAHAVAAVFATPATRFDQPPLPL